MPLPNDTHLIICQRCGVSERRSKYTSKALRYCLACGTAVNRAALKARREAAKEGRAP
jgi:ribosomal protein L37E